MLKEFCQLPHIRVVVASVAKNNIFSNYINRLLYLNINRLLYLIAAWKNL